jgi:hypothetical protein
MPGADIRHISKVMNGIGCIPKGVGIGIGIIPVGAEDDATGLSAGAADAAGWRWGCE